MSLQQLTCQSCGATLPPPAQLDVVQCEYCGAELTVLVAQRIEVAQQTQIPEAIILAQPLPAPLPPPVAPPAPAPPAPVRASPPLPAKAEGPDIPPWASRLLFRAVREIFRRR